MTTKPVERWMLPDGIEEILPGEALQVEKLRQQCLHVLHCWGYDLVIPPMVEFTDSLLVGLGKDIDLLTFKVTDQLSGRSMGIRADMTPQIARIDAHSLNRSGVNRLCYAGHVVRTVMHNALDIRSPIQVGAELFGESSSAADQEIASLLLHLFDTAKVPNVCLDLGHVGIYRALSKAAALNAAQEQAFFRLLQAKALPEINAWVSDNVHNAQAAEWLKALPKMSGAMHILARARTVFENAPPAVHDAINELEALATVVQNRFPGAQLYFDLSELTGYHYLTGLVFAVFTEGRGAAIAKGGRYDEIGEVFGRARSAIGFSADLVVMHRLSEAVSEPTKGIFVRSDLVKAHWDYIHALRASGERVVCASKGQVAPETYQACDRQLVVKDGKTDIVSY